MRWRERVLHRLFGGSDPGPERVGLFDIARALLVDDDGGDAARVAAALARQREERERQQAEQQQRAAAAQVVLDDIRATGWHNPSTDYSWRRRLRGHD